MRIKLPKELRPVSVYSNPNRPRWVFNFDWSNTHYTATINIKDRHFNIHKTFETRGSSRKKYRNIATISFFTIGRMLVLLNKKLPSLYQKYYLRYRDSNHVAKHHDFLLPLECNQGQVSDIIVNEKNKMRLAKEFKLDDFVNYFYLLV